jgi:hypothetical protein
MSIVELNGKVCDTLVIDSESITEKFMTESGDEPDVWKYDPEGTELETDEDLELTEE